MEYDFDRIIERKGTGAINSNLSNSLDTVQLTPPSIPDVDILLYKHSVILHFLN